MLRLRLSSVAPVLTIALLIGPIAAGLAGTVAPAFGYLPALGGESLGLDAWRALLAEPGLGRSVALSLGTALAATAISLALVVLIAASLHGTRAFAFVRRLLSPLLAVPHAAAAFGLAFLIAPSGWMARAVSPWATGWRAPPDLLTVNDPAGLALIAGLVAKETPFLMLMLLAALPQADADRSRVVAMSLGYGPVTAWLKVVLPRVYGQIRLPVFAVLAYSISVVDVALILGPTTPAPLSVRLLQWMRSPDLAQWFMASAGAVLLFGLALVALVLWRMLEAAVTLCGRAWTLRGGRGRFDAVLRALGIGAAAIATGPILFGLAGLALWSVAGPWPWPAVLPDRLDASAWSRALPGLGRPLVDTLFIAAASTALALTLVIASLEAETRRGRRPGAAGRWVLYLPLLIPQVSFLFGLQVLGTAAGLDGTRATVALAHLVFVLPYVYLSLADPWHALDPRHGTIAATLGARPWRILIAVRLPLLLAPVLTAAAVGFSVSIGQYLATLLIGGGRVTTLTTEAVALAAGGDRRLIGVYGLMQMLAPFMGFALALALPAILWRNRRGLRARA